MLKCTEVSSRLGILCYTYGHLDRSLFNQLQADFKLSAPAQEAQRWGHRQYGLYINPYSLPTQPAGEQVQQLHSNAVNLKIQIAYYSSFSQWGISLDEPANPLQFFPMEKFF